MTVVFGKSWTNFSFALYIFTRFFFSNQQKELKWSIVRVYPEKIQNITRAQISQALLNISLRAIVSDTGTWCLTLAWARSSAGSAPCPACSWSPSLSPSSSPTSRGSIIKISGRTREKHRRWVDIWHWEDRCQSNVINDSINFRYE